MPNISLDKLREITPRSYGFIPFEGEFFAAARIPKDSMMDVTNDDIRNLRKALVRFDPKDLSEKLTTIHVFTDSHQVELSTESFMDLLSKGVAQALIKMFRDTQAPRVGPDPNIRKALNMITAKGGASGVAKKSGRFGAGGSPRVGIRGRTVGNRQAPDDRPPKDIHLLATIKAATARAGGSVINPMTGRADIQHQDIMEKVRKPKSPSYVCIVVDTGGGATEDLKVRAVIPTVLSVLKASYERRDQVGFVFCSGNKPKLVETFTSDVEKLSATIRAASFGGLTPLASGVMMGEEYLHKKVGDRGGAVPILVLISDGTANVPMFPGGHIRRELEKVAMFLRKRKTNLYAIDVSLDGNHIVRQLSHDAGGMYYHPSFMSYLAKMQASKALLESFAKGDKDETRERGRDFLARLSGQKDAQAT